MDITPLYPLLSKEFSPFDSTGEEPWGLESPLATYTPVSDPKRFVATHPVFVPIPGLETTIFYIPEQRKTPFNKPVLDLTFDTPPSEVAKKTDRSFVCSNCHRSRRYRYKGATPKDEWVCRKCNQEDYCRRNESKTQTCSICKQIKRLRIWHNLGNDKISCTECYTSTHQKVAKFFQCAECKNFFEYVYEKKGPRRCDGCRHLIYDTKRNLSNRLYSKSLTASHKSS